MPWLYAVPVKAMLSRIRSFDRTIDPLPSATPVPLRPWTVAGYDGAVLRVAALTTLVYTVPPVQDGVDDVVH